MYKGKNEMGMRLLLLLFRSLIYSNYGLVLHTRNIQKYQNTIHKTLDHYCFPSRFNLY